MKKIILLVFFTIIFTGYFYNSEKNISTKKILQKDISKPYEKIDNNIYKYYTKKIDKSSFDIVQITPKNIKKVKFFYKNKNNKRFETINELKKQEKKIIFATNGGIFSKKNKPLGLYIENKIKISEINTKNGEWNFYLKPNGIFYIEKNKVNIVESAQYKDKSSIIFAIQSGPLLVIDNKINSFFNKKSKSKYIRNGVGINKENNLIFVISNKPVTLYEFASLFKNDLKCKKALYLDGAISEIYIPKHRENTERNFSVIIWIQE